MGTQSPAALAQGGFALSSVGPLRWLSLGKGSLPARGSSFGERPRETLWVDEKWRLGQPWWDPEPEPWPGRQTSGRQGPRAVGSLPG